MAVQPNGTAPYAPPATILQVIDRYRDRGLTTPFTADVLERAGVPETLSNRTMQALRLLDLIDDEGRPTAEMEGVRRAAEGEFRDRLAAVIRAAYADVFQFVDPATAEAQNIHDAFRHYDPAGQRSRMVTLFMGLCEAAGIIEAAPKRTPGPKPQAPHRQARPRQSPASRKQQGGSNQPPTGNPAQSGGLFGITEADFANLSDAEIDAVWAALGTVVKAKARTNREGWPKADRTGDGDGGNE